MRLRLSGIRGQRSKSFKKIYCEGTIRHMSQYMICSSNADLSGFGGEILALCSLVLRQMKSLSSINEKDNTLVRSILEMYYPEKRYNEIWSVEIEKYCCKQMDHDEFTASELYCILNSMYNLCEWMLFLVQR